MLLAKSLVLGLAGGFISGLTGMGGGSLFVPVFFFFFDLPIKVSIGTSLLVILFSSSSALITHWRGNQVCGYLSLSIIAGGILGARLGAFLTAILPDTFVKFFFIILVVVTGWKMWSGQNQPDKEENQFSPPVPVWKGLLVGMAGGVVSGMGGVGGAIIIVPLLHLCLHVPMRICIGTVLTAVFFNAFSGSLGYWSENLMEIEIGFLVGLAAMVAAPFGARMSMRMNQAKLRKIFAIVLIIGGLATFLKR